MFPDAWKNALVYPLLKKIGLDLLFKNYRPISTIRCRINRKDSVQPDPYAHDVNSFYPPLKLSYRQFHSTETVLLKVTNDILLKMNTQEVTLLVTLDVSAAFDTTNHGILIDRLNKDAGIQEKALDWFKSYLTNRSQQVSMEQSLSNLT